MSPVRDAGDAGHGARPDRDPGVEGDRPEDPWWLLAEELTRLLRLWQEDLRGHGGPQCRVCPVCQLISVVRNTRPEALEQLAAVAGEVVAAVRSATQPAGAPSATSRPAGAQPGAGGAAGGRARDREPAPVEHIDVTD